MNKGKRILSLLLLCSVCLLFALPTVQAEETTVKPRSVGTVTSYQKITWGISTGRYAVNGIHAFCAQYNKGWPTVGTAVNTISLCTNEVLRKALYYGYNGPENTLGTDDRAHVLTAIAVSDANIGEAETGASSKYDIFYWDIVNNPSKYPSPPSNFKAYMAITASDDLQNLAFYVMEKNGYAKAVKVSSKPAVSSGNSCYSLAGAKYNLYNQASLSASALVGTLTTDANGNSNVVELCPGTYYACETQAPPGFKKNNEVITFTVTSESTTVLNVKDEPQTYPIDILLQKVDAQTGENHPQGLASLQGARFEVKFYAGLWKADADPATLGQKPVRTWVFETDEHGLIHYTKEYKVSGDELFDAFPMGTVTIREVKASEGYVLNDSIYVRQVTSADYQCPVIRENILQVILTKYQITTNIPIPNTVFEHTNPDGSTELVTTDENGQCILKGLQYGEHVIREVSVMDGYAVNEESVTFTVDENTQQNMEFDIYDELVPYDIVLHKKDVYDNLLGGAEFSVYAEPECVNEVTKGVTDEEGILRLKQLEVATKYYLVETKAPVGYELPVDENGQPHVYEMEAHSIPVRDEFIFSLDGEEDRCTTGNTTANREVHIEMTNDVGYTLPNTGSRAVLYIPITGFILCAVSIYLMNKKQNKQ